MNTEIIIYNTQDIQRIMKCGQRQAYDLMKSPAFPSISIGRKRIVEKTAFEKWLNTYKGRSFLL